MALFQQRPQAGDTLKYVTFGQQKTVLIVGLGNVGSQYDNTRHNIGFAALDAFVAKQSDMQTWIEKKDLKAFFSVGKLGETRIIAIKPTTFMNLSGEAVQATAHFYKIDPRHVLVVHDDIDVPFGQIKMRQGGGSAGQNGIKSIIQHLGEDFGRMRVGIGPKNPPQMDAADFVLAKFSSEQQAQLGNLQTEAIALMTEWIYADTLVPETRSFIV